MKKCDAQGLKISDYNYYLPEESIAKYPLHNRGASKLLCYNENISAHEFEDIVSLIPEDSLVVFNNTRVIHARMFFKKTTGAVVEVFCLSPNTPEDYQINFQQTERTVWNCMIGNSKRWKSGSLSMDINIGNDIVVLTATKISKKDETQVEFNWNNSKYTFSDLLEEVGRLPIPPYLHREAEPIDDEAYQTVYSTIEGSVAAPTAGLHFTSDILSKLHSNNVKTNYVTLHVGAGTFRPVKSDFMEGHKMHSEFISVSRTAVESLLDNIDRIIVVGTTSMRTVESLYYIGKQILNNPDIRPSRFFVSQWEPYDEENAVDARQALEAIVNYLDRYNEDFLYAETEIIIVPGYGFHYAKAIVTNFHQPQSTLLLLISAFIGPAWRDVYKYGQQNNFKFLSYGDSSILWRNSK